MNASVRPLGNIRNVTKRPFLEFPNVASSFMLHFDKQVLKSQNILGEAVLIIRFGPFK